MYGSRSNLDQSIPVAKSASSGVPEKHKAATVAADDNVPEGAVEYWKLDGAGKNRLGTPLKAMDCSLWR